MAVDWKPLLDIVRAHQRFVISSHVRPDADALGSEMGLVGVLESLGKTVRIINPSETPNHLKFLDPEGRITKLNNGVTIDEACDTDVHIVVDTSAWGQLAEVGNVLKKTEAKKVVIDHHLSSDDLGAQEFKDTSAAAAGELIVDLAEALDVPLCAQQAQSLFCAIATDTGWFRFPSTTSGTYRTIAKLVDIGAQPQLLFTELYERSSLARLRLHGIVLGRVELACDGKVAHTYVLRKDFKATKTHPSDTEDLVNECLTVDGTVGAFIVVEQRSRQMKVSFRSRAGLDVSQIAEQFGGGGHKQASGAMLDQPLEEAQQKVLAALAGAIEQLD